MKFMVFTTLAAVAVAAPGGGFYSGNGHHHQTYAAPAPVPAASTRQSLFGNGVEQVLILRDDRVQEEGSYSYDVETGDGIRLSQSGSATGPNGAVVKSGEFSYNAPDGTPISLQYVADENGFQPEGDHLPVAPEFPHEIPQFVLDQIAKAAEEDAAAARAEAASFRAETSVPVPSQVYGQPQ